MYQAVKYLPFGDKGIIIEFGDQISPEISRKVRGMSIAVEQSGLEGIISLNPTYRSLLLEYSPAVIRFAELVEQLRGLEGRLTEMELPTPDLFLVPTLYGGEYGPDIQTVMETNSLSEEEVISIHCGVDYLVYMLGFTPGFSYLGGMDDRIVTPRLKVPRTKIPGGSVGIAGAQTGFYSIDSPGGWQLIGRTPIKIYDPYREKPILHRAGDYVRFAPITQEEYDDIAARVEAGTYEYQLNPMQGEEG